MNIVVDEAGGQLSRSQQEKLAAQRAKSSLSAHVYPLRNRAVELIKNPGFQRVLQAGVYYRKEAAEA